FLGVLLDLQKVHQDSCAAMETQQEELRTTIEASREECRTLKIKNLELEKQLTDLRQITRASEPPSHPSISGSLETPRSKLKIPDPPIFLNDSNPTWEDWYMDMKIKLDTDTNRNEKEKMGYVLSRTGGNPRALIQTKYLSGEYFTAGAIIKD